MDNLLTEIRIKFEKAALFDELVALVSKYENLLAVLPGNSDLEREIILADHQKIRSVLDKAEAVR